MQLSLSVRIAEGFLSKEEALLEIEPLCALAARAGYDGICMRASQVGTHSEPQQLQRVQQAVRQAGLSVTMVTGDFDIVYNNERGPQCLRKITPYLDLAEQLESTLVRVALKSQSDISWAQRAADEAHERGISLVHQCHTLSLFETLDSIETTLRAIGRANFGLVFEPANLEICGQPYGRRAVERLAPWILNVYLQNQKLHQDGAITLQTWCRGPVSFDLIQIHESGGVDFPSVLAALRRVGYEGTITVHQSASPGTTPDDSAIPTAQYLHRSMDL